MQGMGSHAYSVTNSLVTALFAHSAYVTSAYWIIAVAFVVLIAAVALRRNITFNLSPAGLAEPRARTYLRVAFGVIWLIDGILQFQPSMPLGLANLVVAPARTGTPGWLHALMSHGIAIWNNHPLALADGAAWIQVGIAVLLLVSNGLTGRLAAAVSVGWAGLIWLVGNGAGGIFAPGANILFGWPGATFFYIVAGVWLALSPSNFPERFTRVTSRLIAVVLGVAIVWQVVPGNGFWTGGNANALTTMSQSMVSTPQPHWLAYSVKEVGVLAGTLGGGYNIIVVLWLAVGAVGLWWGSSRGWGWPHWVVAAGAIYFWFTVQDTALFGGLATDLNSLVPLAALTLCASPVLAARPPVKRRLRPEVRASVGSVLASFATGMVVFAVGTMSLAPFASAETTVYLAQNGNATSTSLPASGFHLTDQSGASYSLGEHSGHYTLLTFLDPVCWTDCPLLGEQLRDVAQSFGPRAPLDVVAVAANPLHESLTDVRHFDALHDLGSVPNFYFVTGREASLARVWNHYGIQVTATAADVMSIHSDLMFIIDPHGQIRWIIPDDPVDGASNQSSAVSELTTLLHRSGVS